MADGIRQIIMALSTVVDQYIEDKVIPTKFLVLPEAKGNKTSLELDFLNAAGIVLDVQGGKWYFSGNPRKQYKFFKKTLEDITLSAFELREDEYMKYLSMHIDIYKEFLCILKILVLRGVILHFLSPAPFNEIKMTQNPRVQMIRGFPFPKVSWFTKEHIEETLDYESRDGDVIVCSYPKTGTTWLQYIALQILSKGKEFPSFNDALMKVVPMMEMTGIGPIDEMQGLRIYKHHYPFNMIKKNKNAKEEKFDFDPFFEEFLTNDVEYGRYFEHVLTYLAHRNDENLLLISYEKLHANRKEGYLRIAKFLGEEYYQNLVTDESLLNTIIQNTSFDYMKKNLPLVHPDPKQPSKDTVKTVEFFRKGGVGDGKNKLSPNQIKRIREFANEVMKGKDYCYAGLINELSLD
ncbi:UNVERIFIED_CONTAM: Sult1b1 [Trichonephila clavipes]